MDDGMYMLGEQTTWPEDSGFPVWNTSAPKYEE